MMTLLGRAALLLTLTALAACGKANSAPPEVEALFLRHEGGVAVLEPGSSSPTLNAVGATPSLNWSSVIKAWSGAGETTFKAFDADTEDELWTRSVEGRFRVKTVSSDGTVAAASPRKEAYFDYGRTRTQLLVVSETSSRLIELAGNYEPEAFSTDGESLFVIKYMPARNPTRYQVRRLDVSTGTVHGVYTPHAELQRSMGGTARIQSASPDGKRLYTLYTVGANEEAHAFIHVLDLEEKWAHCIDLPDGFARANRRSTAIGVSSDGKSVYVADRSTGTLAEVNTVTLQVERSTVFGSMPAGKAFVTSAPDGSVYIASGHSLQAFDGDLVDRWSSRLQARIVGIQATSDKVYVGSPTTLKDVDVDTGDVTSSVDPPGIERITSLGPVLELELPPILKCAC
jgi:outer membrane protein assembly factor BamB